MTYGSTGSHRFQTLSRQRLPMKANIIIAIMLITGAIYYWSDAEMLLGINGPQTLPDTVAPPNSTFLGNEVTNPYFKK